MHEKKLMSEVYTLSPTVRIGKSGVTEKIINEIILQLQKKHLVKVKILSSAFETMPKDEIKKFIVNKVIEKYAYATVVSKVGNTITFYAQR